MNFKDVVIISIIGKQNSGKTTLINKIIPKLKKLGYSVGTFKYKIREFEIDHKGKDTYKYFRSGADTVAISSQNELAVIKKVEILPQINEIIQRYFDGIDVILIEGYRGSDYPRIKIVNSHMMELTEDNSKYRTNSEITLINIHSRIEGFSLKNLQKALEFITNIISHK